MQSAFDVLQLSHVLDHIAGLAKTEQGKNALLALRPLEEKTREYEHENLRQAMELIDSSSALPLNESSDLSKRVDVARKGGTLQEEDFSRVLNDLSTLHDLKKHLSSLYSDLFGERSDNIIDDDSPVNEIYTDRNTVTDFIYMFDSLSSAITACSIGAPEYHGDSALYKMEGKFYLVLRCSYSEFTPAARNCFMEYGEFCPLHSGSVGMLTEYGKTIIKEDAVISLAKCK